MIYSDNSAKNHNYVIDLLLVFGIAILIAIASIIFSIFGGFIIALAGLGLYVIALRVAFKVIQLQRVGADFRKLTKKFIYGICTSIILLIFFFITVYVSPVDGVLNIYKETIVKVIHIISIFVNLGIFLLCGKKLIDLFSKWVEYRVSLIDQKPITHIDAKDNFEQAELINCDFFSDRNKLKPALNIMSVYTGMRFHQLTEQAVLLYKETDSLKLNNKASEKDFQEDLQLINQILNVFIKNTLDNCEKAFSGTQFIDDLRLSFNERFGKGILDRINSYSSQLDEVKIKIENYRLAMFGELDNGVDLDVDDILALHNRIVQASGNKASKAITISNNVIKEVLPSLVQTRKLAQNTEQARIIDVQFKQLKYFLENQLSKLKSNPDSKNLSDNYKCLLTLDASTHNDLDNKITQNSRYLKELQTYW